MANNISSFDFVLSAGVDTSAIKQDILKAYKDVQVNINGQKLTISNVVIDTEDALASFKKQINQIGLSNGIKLEIDTKAFQDAKVAILDLQSTLDKTNKKAIDDAFVKKSGALVDTFKTLTKEIKLSEKELEQFNKSGKEAFEKYGKKKDQGNTSALKSYQNEYIENQKLYQVMQQQITSVKELSSIDGWSKDITSLTDVYRLLKSIEAIQSHLKGTKYSDSFSTNFNVNDLTNLNMSDIKAKYDSLVNDLENRVRGYENTMRAEFNKVIDAWINATRTVEDNPLSLDVQDEDTKQKIVELEKLLESLRASADECVQQIRAAEQSISNGLPEEDTLAQAQANFDKVTKKIQETVNEITNLKVVSSDFAGLTDDDVKTQAEKALGAVNKLTREIENLDATRVDISGLSDDEILNRIREVQIALSDMVKGGQQKTPEFQGLLAQFKMLYEYATSNNLDLSKTGFKENVLNARMTAAQKIQLFNEETYNNLIKQRNEQQAIVEKCKEELRLRKNIDAVKENTKPSSATSSIPTDSDKVLISDDVHIDGKQANIVDGELVSEVKLVPDMSTFKADAEQLLSGIALEKEVKLNPIIDKKSSAIDDITNINVQLDTLKRSLDAIAAVNIDFTGFEQLKNLKSLDLSKLNIKSDVLENFTSLAQGIQTLQVAFNESSLNEKIVELKSALSGLDLSALKDLKIPKNAFDALSKISEDDVFILRELVEILKNLSTLSLVAIDKDLLSGLKLTKAQAQNLEAVAQGIISLKTSLTGFDSVVNSIQAIDTLITKIATLKGVVNNIKDIEVEVVEDANGKKTTKVGEATSTKSSKNVRKEVTDVDKLNEAYDKLSSTLNKINDKQIQLAKGNLSGKENRTQLELNELQQQQISLEEAISKYNQAGITSAEKEVALERQKVALAQDLANVNTKTTKASDSQENRYKKASEIDSSLYIDDVSFRIDEAKAKLSEYFNDLNDGSKRSKDEIAKLNKQFDQQLELINKLTITDNLKVNKQGREHLGVLDNAGDIEQMKTQIIDYLNSLGRGKVTFETFTAGHKAMIVSMRGSDNQIKKYKISLGNYEQALDEAKVALYGLYQGEKTYTSFGSKWLSGLKSKIVQLTQYISGIEIIMKAWQALQRGFETIRELDTALTEMRKVSDETVVSLRQFQKASFDIAKTVGATASTIQNSTADFMRIGESLSQAAESASVANILLNVSEFESIDEATESLIAMSQAYQDLDKIDIVDIMNNLGNNFAISTDGLATALQNSASALVTAKNDIYEASALATAANTVVQDPDKVGAGLRTIALRITGTESAREELQSLGEDVDDFVVTTSSKLNQQVMDLTKTTGELGVSLLDANGNYRSTYEILQDIADIWEKIAEEDLATGENRQNALLELLAGKNRSNILASILQNPDTLRDAFNAALGSDGSAQKELDKYLDSIDGKITQLTNNVQEFWATFIDTDVVKDAIDVLSDIVKFGTTLVDIFGSLPVVLSGAAAAFTIFNKNSRGRAKMFAPKIYKDASGEFSSDVYELCVA